MIVLCLGGGLLLAALLLAVHQARRAAPALRRSLIVEHCHPSREAANVMVYHDERAALQRAFDAGELSKAQFKSAAVAADRRLVEAIRSGEDVASGSVNAGKHGLLIAAVLAAVLVVVGYWHYGAHDDLRLHDAWQRVASQPHASVHDYIETLEPLARQQPHNPHVWAVLWPLYTAEGHYDEAIFALKEQMRLEGESVQGLAQLAQMRFMASGGVATPDIDALCRRVLAAEPQHPAIQSMLGVIAYARGDYQLALDHWQLALDGGADQQGAGQQVREHMAEARQRLHSAASAQRAQ